MMESWELKDVRKWSKKGMGGMRGIRKEGKTEKA